MHCFLLPKSTLPRIHINNFRYWWRSSVRNRQPIHWLKSSVLFKHKDTGGLAFRDMFHFNGSLLAKLAWMIVDQPNLLVSKIIKSKYFREGSFWDANIGRKPSKIRKSVFSVQDIIRKTSRYDTGDARLFAKTGTIILQSSLLISSVFGKLMIFLFLLLDINMMTPGFVLFGLSFGEPNSI